MPAMIPTRVVECVVAESFTTASGGRLVPDGDAHVYLPDAVGTPLFEFANPGHFGGFQADGRDARLVFRQPGTYTFAKFHLNSGAEFTIEVPQEGKVVIEVCGPSDPYYTGAGAQLELAGRLNLERSDGRDVKPHQVQFYTNVNLSIPTSAEALQGLLLVAPLARVYSAGAAGAARGQILAREIDLVTNIDLDSGGFTGEACLQAGVLAPAINACPVSLNVPSMPPTRVPGCLSGEDCQANSRCTEVSTAPACAHSKCLEGALLSSACEAADACVQRICEVDGSCCEQDNGLICLPGNLCSATQCGDGLPRGLELCDDGNAGNGDGCSASCTVERGYVCSGEPSVCRATVCGDGIREGSEDCDDGALAPWDGCSPTCELEPSCPAQGGSCSSQCGDGITLAGDAEDCDDGNTIDGDGCSSTCAVESGFTCAPQVGATAPFIQLPVVYRDFASTGPSQHPDFQAFRGRYPTRGMVETVLGVDGLPVYTGICETPNAITLTTCPNLNVWDGYMVSDGYTSTSAANFNQWYRPSALSTGYWETIQLDYSAPNYVFAPGNSFYPLTGRPQMVGDSLLGASIGTNENFSFTSEVRHWFEYRGGEVLTFQGDDDVWVFINGQLALDLGGPHKALAGQVTLSAGDALEEWVDDDGPHSLSRPLGLVVGNAYEIVLFHAERLTWESNFTLTLSGFFDAPSLCTPICGDGNVVRGEVCDDGVNDGGSGECQPGCRSWDETGIPLDTWGPHCVALVKSECAAYCGDATTATCTHGACEVGVALDSSCSECASDVCSFPGLAYCCDGAMGSWDAACINMANQLCSAPGDRACDYAVMSGATVHIEGFQVSGGLVGGRTGVLLASGAGGDAQVGDVVSVGAVDIQSGTAGNVTSAGAISESGGQAASINPYQDVKTFPVTERSFTCGGSGTTTIATGTSTSLSPGTYQGIAVADGGTLILSAAGDYFINRLEILGQAVVVLPNSGFVNLHICQDLRYVGSPAPSTLGPRMRLASGATPSQTDGGRVRFFIDGASQTRIANFAEFWGMLFAPHADVFVGADSHVHGMIHAGGAVTQNSRGSVNGSGITGAACVAAQIVEDAERPESECDYAILTPGSSTIVGATVLGGDVKSAGAISALDQNWNCELPAAGTCNYTPSIDGSVFTSGAFAGCPYVTGSCNSNLGVTMSVPPIARRAFACPTGGTAVILSSGDPFPPGSYGAVTVVAGETVQFEAGNYRVASLSFQNGAVVSLPTTGAVSVDSCARIYVGSGVSTTGVTSSADALRFQLYTDSPESTALPGTRADNAIYVGQGSSLFATLTAPNGAVLLDSWSTVYGFIHANQAILTEGVTLDATGSAGENCAVNPQFGSCDASEIAGGSQTITDAGICVANGESFLDVNCPLADLAVDFGCDGQVPVCNHGALAAPAGVELSFYPRAGHQFASESPDPTWLLGTCVLSEPIPSGSCVTAICDPALTGIDSTVIANLDESVSECSLLDNWSLNDASEECHLNIGVGTDSFTEIYEASCPSGARPHWGFMSWHAQTPGTSWIDFSVRAAGSSSALASQTYVQIGRAAQAPDDTQDCPFLSPLTQCPVEFLTQLPPTAGHFTDATNAMTGAREAISFLELAVDINSVGSDLSVLEDWTITYSCVFDQ